MGANQNLRPYSEGQIGWLTRDQGAETTEKLDVSGRFQELFSSLAPSETSPSLRSTHATQAPLTREELQELLPLPVEVAPDWQSLGYLLVCNGT